MSNIITSTGRSINTVTAEIIAISNQAAQMAYMSMIEIGKRLVEAKALVDHGEWGPWLKNEVKFSQRTANNFMQIYERSLTGANSHTFANLGYSQIVKLLALPEGELEEFTETHDVQNMSVRQLDQAIKERDEERRLRSEAQAEAEAAKSSEEAWQQEIDKLNAALNKATAAAEKAKKQVKELKVNPQLSDEQKERLLAEAKAQAAEEVRAELQSQLEAAQQAAQAAAHEKEAAEKAAQDAQAKMSNMKKDAQMANPDVMAFNLLGKQILDDFNRLAGYRLKVGAGDPDMDAKMKEFMLKLAERLRSKAEGGK